MNYAVNSTFFTTSILSDASAGAPVRARSDTKVTPAGNMAVHQGLRTQGCSADTLRRGRTPGEKKRKAQVSLAIKEPIPHFMSAL